jgi:hypothetical protein
MEKLERQPGIVAGLPEKSGLSKPGGRKDALQGRGS